MKENVIICLHGFLGRPSDWNFLENEMALSAPHSSSFQFIKLDYFGHDKLNPQYDFEQWCFSFEQYLVQNFSNKNIILIGYSLGGRLLLNFLLKSKIEIDKAILISTGLSRLAPEQKVLRAQNDASWAQDFLNLAWDDVLKKWNGQEVFRNSQNIEPVRIESDYIRDTLAKALTQWSPAVQQDLSVGIEDIEPQILWLVGQEDHKYVEQLNYVQHRLAGHPRQDQFVIVPNSGHRVFFEKPQIVSQKIRGFLLK